MHDATWTRWGLQWIAVAMVATAGLGCSDSAPSTAATAAADGKAAKGGDAKVDASAASALVGKPAPEVSLKDLDGNDVSLASFKGKTVVLEWFNPGCPFVVKSHTVGSLKGLSKKVTEGGKVVWLSINSGAPGKQGHGVETNKEARTKFGMENPILIDEDGKVGRAYGATNTPHMYVVNGEGVVVYAGAIDNSPDGEGQSPAGGTLVNHVTTALDELAAGKPVSTASTKAYGCSVKYGS